VLDSGTLSGFPNNSLEEFRGGGIFVGGVFHCSYTSNDLLKLKGQGGTVLIHGRTQSWVERSRFTKN